MMRQNKDRRSFLYLLISSVATFALVVTCGSVFLSTVQAEEASPKKGTINLDEESMRPFWKTKRMSGESVLFLKSLDEKPVTGRLYFTPESIHKITNSTGTVTYHEGKDYQFTAGSKVLTIPAGSSIPVADPARLTPPLGSQPFNLKRRDKTGDILFGSGLEYAEMQVLVTYDHPEGEWTGPTPQCVEADLPLTLAKLKAGEPLKIVLFGDSISQGGNASNFFKAPPFTPPYGELVIQNLERVYKGPITFSNKSKGGMWAEWGFENVASVIEEKPDLVILAWGMNDNTSPTATGDAKPFVQSLKKTMDKLKESNPNVEFILVATMFGNPDWHLIRIDRILQFRDGIKTLVKPGVAMADLTSVWEEFLKGKNFADMIGNGVNHPNDFGHRLYAQVVSSLLIEY